MWPLLILLLNWNGQCGLMRRVWSSLSRSRYYGSTASKSEDKGPQKIGLSLSLDTLLLLSVVVCTPFQAESKCTDRHRKEKKRKINERATTDTWCLVGCSKLGTKTKEKKKKKRRKKKPHHTNTYRRPSFLSKKKGEENERERASVCVCVCVCVCKDALI